MDGIKKVAKFLRSMQFAILLLVILAVSCGLGSFLTQGKSYEWYAAAYSERTAGLIIALGLDDVFHSPWFVVITIFLCANLLLCNLIRVPSLIRQWEQMKKPVPVSQKVQAQRVDAKGQCTKETALAVFAAMGFRRVKQCAAEKGEDAPGPEEGPLPVFYACKNRAGLWGAWICHLGILILIIGFGFGQMTKKEYMVYGVPGQTRQVGDTSLLLTIDDFQIGLRKDDTVEQYTSDVTVRNASTGEARTAVISVNHPATLYGMRFYQNSTGWAATISVQKDGKEIQSEVVCAGDYLEVKDKEGLVILFSAFYPDYEMDPVTGPHSKSSAMNNPGYLYRAYYKDNVIGMNVLTKEDVITIDEYTVLFSQPQSYTLIQIKKDSFTPLALLGALVVMLGLLLSFYIQPSRLWAFLEEDGSYTVAGSSQKGGILFEEKLRKCLNEAGAMLTNKGESGT